jgi:hypothetical protein
MESVNQEHAAYHMTTSTKVIIIGVWLALVIPQIFISYGTHVDAWLVAWNAERMWNSGVYTPSRSTGFPVFEYLVTPLVHWGGWPLSNLGSVVAGLFMVTGLFELAKRNHFRYPLITIITISFLPIIMDQATSTIDFMYNIAMMIWTIVLLSRKRYLWAAVLIGVGCGFRPNTGVMIIPAIVWAWHDRVGFKTIFLMGMIAVLTGALAFSPALLKYGIRNPASLSRELVSMSFYFIAGFYKWLKVFGIVQTGCVFTALLVFAIRKWKSDRPWFNSRIAWYHGANFLMWNGLYLIHPFKPEYYLLAVPSIIILVDQLVDRKVYIALAVILMSYHVVQFDVLGGESGARVFEPQLSRGYTHRIIDMRRFHISTREAATLSKKDRPTLLMFGLLWTMPNNDGFVYDREWKLWRQRDGNLFINEEIVDIDRLKDLHARGMEMYVWRGSKGHLCLLPDQVTWQKYVRIFDDLETFYGHPIRGRRLQ